MFLTIGTNRTLDACAELSRSLNEKLGNSYEGMTVVFIEQIFDLYENDENLSFNHIQYTDFFRKDYPASIEFESDSVSNPVCYHERCAIYDGGSRAFEPKTYLNNLIRYWESLKNISIGIDEYLYLKSNLMDYVLTFEDWLGKRGWWEGVDEDHLASLHKKGHDSVNKLVKRNFDEIIEDRLKNLYDRRKLNGNPDIH